MSQGRRRPLSPARNLAIELLRHAKKVPSLPLTRRVNVRDLVELRAKSSNPVSWLALFLRAYGLTGKAHPELRTALIPYPWPHLYEHPETMSALLIEREWQGEPVVLAAKIRGAENQPIRQIHNHLRRFKEAPVQDITDFRQLLRLGQMSWLIRRIIFWQTLYWSGKTRATRFGTCMVSSMGYLNARQIHPLTPLTTYFSAGPVQPNGDVDLTISYDHRVMDDGHVGRCLRSLDAILHETIRLELREDVEQGARLSA